MQRHSRLLAEHLARAGRVELTVIHPHPGRLFDPVLNIREVQVRDIDRSKLYIRELWRYSGRMEAALEGLDADVVLSQGFCVWKGITRFSNRLIIMPHGLEMFQSLGRGERLATWPFRLALRHVVRRSAVVVSLGGKLNGILQDLVKGSGCRVVVIPNATEVPGTVVPPVHGEGRPLDLLFVGRFAFNKGIDLLVEVARRLEREGHAGTIRFQLAGDGPLLDGYRTAGLPANVALLGRVDDDRLFELYARCDALVLPTRFEGMPTVVLEAMARAKPVIVSDVGASSELVDMHNGYLLPPGDAEALYQAIRSFAERPREVHRRMGEVSLQRVRERFNWPVIADRFVDLLTSFKPAPPTAGGR